MDTSSIQIPDATEWEIRILPEIRKVEAGFHDAAVGPYRVRLLTNQADLLDRFRKDHTEAEGDGRPDAAAYVIVEDDGADPVEYFHPPDCIYARRGRGDYEEIRLRLIGCLEACAASRIEMDEKKQVQRPEDACLLLYGSGLSLPDRGGMVFIGQDDSFKRDLGLGLSRWKKDSVWVPSGVFLVRLGDRALLRSEMESLTDVVLVRRDYEDTRLLAEVSFSEAMRILTGPDNAPVYEAGKTDADGYGRLRGWETVPYYNPCILHTEIDPEQGTFGRTDRRRIASFLHLAREGQVRFLLANPRLPFEQMQFCARKVLSGAADSAEVLKGKEVPDDPIWALGLKKRSKPAAPGRREIDLMGFWKEQEEAEVVSFHRGESISELIAFLKGKTGRDQIHACSRSDLPFFFKSEAHLGVDELFP
jgi:hypothetical protein